MLIVALVLLLAIALAATVADLREGRRRIRENLARLHRELTTEELLELCPVELRDAVEARGDSEDFAREVALEFLNADADDQAAHLAFLRDGGPEKCRQLRVEHETGAPTAAELETWMLGPPPL